ncbi:MAG: hypothetical protein V1874_09080 [Spirochaetota bacterium]
MKYTNLKVVLVILILLFADYSSSQIKKKPVIQWNQAFYTKILNLKAIERDSLLNEMQNSIVQGRAYVESVEKTERYRRHFRITAIDNEASDLNIRLYIFTDNQEYLTLLQKGDFFDFKGQFVVYTPLNSRRDSYIFDIILEEGALSVK